MSVCVSLVDADGAGQSRCDGGASAGVCLMGMVKLVYVGVRVRASTEGDQMSAYDEEDGQQHAA